MDLQKIERQAAYYAERGSEELIALRGEIDTLTPKAASALRQILVQRGIEEQESDRAAHGDSVSQAAAKPSRARIALQLGALAIVVVLSKALALSTPHWVGATILVIIALGWMFLRLRREKV